jgi:hypothetical protein
MKNLVLAVVMLTLSAASASSQSAVEALAEVNAQRAARGLQPFVFDEGLTKAAMAAAEVRAANRIAGHLPSDFAYLPPGCSADAAGCGALDPSWGFAACCVYDNHVYAGAAFVMGKDGKKYCHIFVRGRTEGGSSCGSCGQSSTRTRMVLRVRSRR